MRGRRKRRRFEANEDTANNFFANFLFVKFREEKGEGRRGSG